MAVNSIVNFFSFSQIQQEETEEPSFVSQTAVIGFLAIGLLGSLQYAYTKYSAYQTFCQGLNRWAEAVRNTNEYESRCATVKNMKQCYWQIATTLDLRRLGLTSLPPEIGQLKNLQNLYLRGNELQELLPEIGQLTNLAYLDLAYNQLRELPPEIGQLRNLHSLNLHYNQLQELPPEIGQLTNLQILNLSDNQLQELPPEIGRLRNLHTLNLPDNQLQELPPEIRQLTNLANLELAYNLFQEIPQEIEQLTNLRQLDFRSSDPNISQEFVSLLRNRGVTVLVGFRFTLNLERLQDDPIGVLQILHEGLKANHSFPLIRYEGLEGRDAGGLSRDFVTRLFNRIFDKNTPCLPVYALGEYFLPVVEESDKSHHPQLLYQAIGMIFAAAISKGSHPIVTGNHFHSVLFEMLYSLSLENVNHLPQGFTTLEDLSEHKGVLKKLLASYLISKMEGLAEQKKENGSQLADAFIENQFPDPFGIYESKEDFLNTYSNADKLILGALAIAQGMYLLEGKWEFNSPSAIELQINIEGYFSREEVEKALSWPEGENGEQNARTKEFLIRWIRDEETSLATLSQFLFALTGSGNLIKGKNPQVSFYSAEGPNEALSWYPKYHTCGDSLMEIPRNYPDYETLKCMLEASIRVAPYGFQAE